jgi:hypothetical protein
MKLLVKAEIEPNGFKRTWKKCPWGLFEYKGTIYMKTGEENSICFVKFCECTKTHVLCFTCIADEQIVQPLKIITETESFEEI